MTNSQTPHPPSHPSSLASSSASPLDSDTKGSTIDPVVPPHEPMLNIPPATFCLTLILVVCFALWHYLGSYVDTLFIHFIFVPAAFTFDPVGQIYTLVTYALLHFNMAHLVMNGTGLLAFGGGLERLMGKRYLLGIFFGGVIIGVLGYWVFFSQSTTPLIGASGGVSALFGAILPLIVRRPQILVASILFILVNVIFGTLGMPNEPGSSASIAWQAHIAGFLFGELTILAVLRFQIAHYKNSRRGFSRMDEKL